MTKSSALIVVAVGLAVVLAACGPEPTPTLHPDPPYAVVAAEQELSEELGIPVDEIDYVSFSREEWPDACLGLADPDEMCAQVITPGWRVVLKAEGQQHVFRTDVPGEAIRREE